MFGTTVFFVCIFFNLNKRLFCYIFFSELLDFSFSWETCSVGKIQLCNATLVSLCDEIKGENWWDGGQYCVWTLGKGNLRMRWERAVRRPALFTADGLFDVDLKELDRQRLTEGSYSRVRSHSAIQSKAKSYFNFLEVESILQWQGPPPLVRLWVFYVWTWTVWWHLGALDLQLFLSRSAVKHDRRIKKSTKPNCQFTVNSITGFVAGSCTWLCEVQMLHSCSGVESLLGWKWSLCIILILWRLLFSLGIWRCPWCHNPWFLIFEWWEACFWVVCFSVLPIVLNFLGNLVLMFSWSDGWTD